MTVVPFNPLDRKNLQASVAEALLGSRAIAMGDLKAFDGAGIYAIYYSGHFEPYAPIGHANRSVQDNPLTPIYVGKAVPSGARKGLKFNNASSSRALFARLKEHRESIEAVINLGLDDFSCRYLVVDDIWIPLGESLLISKFSPLWNTLIDGFGNHDPGSGRYLGLTPRWDVLHPGRAWATKCKARMESDADIIRDIKSHLAANPPVTLTHVLGPTQ